MSHTSNCHRMLMVLSSRTLVKAKELAEILEVSERMIRVYKEDLEMAGYHIGSKAGRYGGYYLEQKSFLPNIDFDEKEVATLDMAYDYIQKSTDFPAKARFQMLYHHISSMSHNNEESDQYLYFIHKSRPSTTLTKSNEVFLQLRKAIIEKKKVVIRYQGWSGSETVRKIRPHGLVNYEGSWYCRGFCEKKQEWRTFKLLRILQLTETEEYFEREKSFNIREEKLGLFDDPHDVELHIVSPLSLMIAENIWGENQEIIRREDDSVTFRARMFGIKSIVKWILSMGSMAKVIGSDEIRKEVKKEIEKMKAFY